MISLPHGFLTLCRFYIHVPSIAMSFSPCLNSRFRLSCVDCCVAPNTACLWHCLIRSVFAVHEAKHFVVASDKMHAPSGTVRKFTLFVSYKNLMIWKHESWMISSCVSAFVSCTQSVRAGLWFHNRKLYWRILNFWWCKTCVNETVEANHVSRMVTAGSIMTWTFFDFELPRDFNLASKIFENFTSMLEWIFFMYLIQFTYVSIKLRWFNTGVST